MAGPRQGRSSYEPDPEKEPVPKRRRRVFVPDPGALSRRAVMERNAYGTPVTETECDDAEAASHWDTDHWRRIE